MSIRALGRALGRALRRLVLPLVGFWDLVRRLDELRALIAAMQPHLDRLEAQFAAEAEWARQRHEAAALRHEASHSRFDDLTRRLAAIESEQIRLAARNGPLATVIAAELATVVAAEIDRLDGYLVHHATTLGARLEALSDGQRARLAYAGPGLDALVMTGDFDLVVPAAEEGLLVYILRHGLEAVEPGVRALLRRRLKPGGVAVDAGANIGVHSLAMAAAVGSEGRVLCFEPLEHLASSLERSLRLNGFAGRARVERAALADHTGQANFHRAAHGPMSSLYALPQEAVADDTRVRVTTLDASLPPGSRVDLVKMDVEGAEPRVWRGMQRVVAENPAIELVLEWSASHFRRSGEDAAAFMAAIRAAGFQAFEVEDGATPGRLAPVGHPEALEAANLLLTRAQVATEELAAA
jgi:FkbM family methyltransferase